MALSLLACHKASTPEAMPSKKSEEVALMDEDRQPPQGDVTIDEAVDVPKETKSPEKVADITPLESKDENLVVPIDVDAEPSPKQTVPAIVPVVPTKLLEEANILIWTSHFTAHYVDEKSAEIIMGHHDASLEFKKWKKTKATVSLDQEGLQTLIDDATPVSPSVSLTIPLLDSEGGVLTELKTLELGQNPMVSAEKFLIDDFKGSEFAKLDTSKMTFADHLQRAFKKVRIPVFLPYLANANGTPAKSLPVSISAPTELLIRIGKFQGDPPHKFQSSTTVKRRFTNLDNTFDDVILLDGVNLDQETLKIPYQMSGFKAGEVPMTYQLVFETEYRTINLDFNEKGRNVIYKMHSEVVSPPFNLAPVN